MSNAFDKYELLELCGAVIDEHASPEQIVRLNEILESNPAAQNEYATYMMLHAEMFWHSEMYSPANQSPDLSHVSALG